MTTRARYHRQPQRSLALSAEHIPGATKARNVLHTTEADVQRAVLALLQRHPAVSWCARMNTGAGHLARPDGSQGQFVRFAFRGCSDILGQLRDGRMLAVECKRPDGRLTDDQAAFLDRVNQHNGVAFVARSADDVMRHIAAAGEFRR